MTEEPISIQNEEKTSDEVESPDLTIHSIEEDTEGQEPETHNESAFEEEETNSTNDSQESSPESEKEPDRHDTDKEDMGKVGLMVPKARVRAQEEAIDAGPENQSAKPGLPPQQSVYKAASAPSPQQDAKRSLPIPLQSLKPRQKPLWFKAMRQPWFKRIQEKTIFQNISRSPKIHPNSLLVVCLAALVIALQGYLNLSLPNLTIDAVNNVLSQFNIPETQWLPSIPITYNFQLPLALLAGAVLGSILGGLTVLVFLAIGLFSTPIFANGGGLDYLYQPGFPFLAAMFIGAIFSGYFTKVAFSPKRTAKQALYLYGGGIMSTLITHILALAGLTLLLLVTSPFLAPAHPIASWWEWILHLSLEPLPYDLMATCLFLWFTRYIRLTVYPALY